MQVGRHMIGFLGLSCLSECHHLLSAFETSSIWTESEASRSHHVPTYSVADKQAELPPTAGPRDFCAYRTLRPLFANEVPRKDRHACYTLSPLLTNMLHCPTGPHVQSTPPLVIKNFRQQQQSIKWSMGWLRGLHTQEPIPVYTLH